MKQHYLLLAIAASSAMTWVSLPMACAQDGDKDPISQLWIKAGESLYSSEEIAELGRKSAEGGEEQRQLVAAFVGLLEEAKARQKENNRPVVYADIAAMNQAGAVSHWLNVRPWVFVDVVVERLNGEDKTDDDLLGAVLVGANAFRTEPVWSSVFHRYPHISEYLQTTDTAPSNLPRPLIMQMMQRDAQAAIYTLKPAQKEQARRLTRAAGILAFNRYRLRFDENHNDPMLSDSVQLLANHETWYVRLYLASILRNSRELAERIDPSILESLAEDLDEDVQRHAKSIREVPD